MEEGVSLSGKTLTFLGAGSTARAAAVECAVSGARKIYIVNRSEERGRMLEELISSRTQAEAQYIFWEKGVKIPEDTDILVQATSLGMEEELPDINYGSIRPEIVACDMVFCPRETEFLKRAGECGAKTISGISMLLSQTVLNYSLWTNISLRQMSCMRRFAECFRMEIRLMGVKEKCGQREGRGQQDYLVRMRQTGV